MKQKGFILELAIDAVMFIVCAAICSALTVQAYLTVRDGARLTTAVGMAQEAAELYMATGTAAEAEADGIRIEVSEASGRSATIRAFHGERLIYEIPEVPHVQG